MLLSRAILKNTRRKWKQLLETHDSYFIGADVFYSFVINNKCWWERHQMKSSSRPVEAAEEIRTRLLQGKFQRDILNNFREILNYFGQSPIIVRSSSLLEDAYGNAFSGKYESVFCANQGTPEERLNEFKNAVRTVYASSMRRRS
jgi:pyruvate, water dikinase